MNFYQAELDEVVQRDARYPYEAYEFLYQALEHTQKVLGREPPERRVSYEEQDVSADRTRYHVSGGELVHGFRDLALCEFGMMAGVVFKLWGIRRTADVGAMVFNLVDAKLMNKTDEDRREDFDNVFDWEEALGGDFRFELDEAREL